MPEATVPEAMRWAGGMLRAGRASEAAFVYRQVVGQEPGNFEAHLGLGEALLKMGSLDEAERSLVEASRLRPSDPAPYVSLGHVYRRRDRAADAVHFFRLAVEREPSVAKTYQSLGSACREVGRLDEAIAAFRRALELQPDFHRVHSNLIYLLYYHPGYTPEMVLAEHREWARRHAERFDPKDPQYPNGRDPNRRLRVGYVSPDLRNHALGLYIEPVIQNHDRERFEVFCYADVPRPDELTARLRARADGWRDTAGVPDEQMAGLIRRDRIDVLVDLTLHMRGSRLTVFARRPAPVQITYMAYPGTSGMGAIDYKITDVHLDPPGMTEAYHAERLLRLPETYWCYRQPENCPEVNALPAEANGGGVTFGALNAFAKINPQVVALWARVLDATLGSRLLALIAGGEQGNQEAREMFRRGGIEGARLDLLERRPRAEFCRYFHRVDVSLDPFPYNGHTTTLDSLWMGVPVITLEGGSAVGRAGVSILSNLKATEWVARTPDAYVAKATGLAGDLTALRDIRAGLRARMSASPLLDAPRLTRHVERLYRAAWTTWAAQ